MFGTHFVFKRAGSSKKITARLNQARTELWIDHNPVARYSEPVWLYQKEPLRQPEVIYREIDTAVEMAKIFEAKGYFRVTAREFAEALFASCPRDYDVVGHYLYRKRCTVMDVNLLNDFDFIVEEVRYQLDKIKEEINVRKSNTKTKKPTAGQPSTRSKRTNKNHQPNTNP
jgi:hypothetical protein